MSKDAALYAAQLGSSSRASSLAGTKRARESDPEGRRSSRRTRSEGRNGDATVRDPNGTAADSRDQREREAFQRQLIGVFVPRALKESHEGALANYNDLLAHFLPSPTQPVVQLAPLLPLLRALTAHVSLLDPSLHTALVTAIVGLDWAAADDRFVKAYIGFAGVLVSAHPSWAKEIVGMAVKGLTWQSALPNPTGTAVTRRAFHARHHLLLSHLLSLIPTLPTVLQPLLTRHAPHKREPEVAQTTWVRNCCELIEYCPELGARVWSGLIDRMLRIDVEITNSVENDDDDDEDDDDDDDDDDDEDADEPNLDESDPFDLLITDDVPNPDAEDDDDADSDDEGDLDPDALSSDDEQDSDDEDHSDAARAAARARKRDALRSLRRKLDGMLLHFLRHLDENMGDRERGLSAAEMAAQCLVSGASSGVTTPRPGTPTTPTSATTPTYPSSAPTPAPLFTPRPPPTPAQSLAHFQTLLTLFSRQILPTSATQHLPFLLFMCSSFSPAHTELFLHLLVSQSLYATTSAAPASLASHPVSLPQRVAATVYIGSLVCRARYVTDDQARTVMAYLLAYVDGKLAQAAAAARGGGVAGVGIDELPLFYAVCQAAMLIFCFRWRAFTLAETDDVVGEMDLDDGSGDSNSRWMRDLDTLQRALTSDLNPLLGCNPTIVNTFAKVAHSTGFAYCFSIIEANQHAAGRSAARKASTTSLNTPPHPTPNAATPRRFARTASAPALPVPPALAAPRAARQANIDAGLDSYFPFDPYDLPRSGTYVERLYRTWDEVAVDMGGDDSDSDGETEDTDMDMASMADSDMDDLDDLDGADGRYRRANRGMAMPVPRAPKAGSFGERRRNILRDGGLSTSLENMSISPAQGVFGEA